MKLTEIAERIDAHLKRHIEDDIRRHGFRCRANHRRLYVQYGFCAARIWLCKADAEMYLRWLDADNVGTHDRARAEAKSVTV